MGDELCEFGSGRCAHTRACPVNVALDSTYRQGEGLGDLVVRQTVSDQGGDLAFAVAQRQTCGLGGRGDGSTLGDQSFGAAAGGEGRPAPILSVEYERGVSGRVGCGDAIAHRLEVVRDGQQSLPAVLVRQRSGPARHQPCAGTLHQLGEFGKPGGGVLVAELNSGLQTHRLATVLPMRARELSRLPSQGLRL